MTVTARVAKSILIAVLLLAVQGCAGYRLASLPGGQADRVAEHAPDPAKPGSRVRITMRSGEERYGRLMEMSTSEIVLRRGSGSRVEETRIAISDIHCIETEGTSSTRSALLAAVIAIAGAAVYFAHEMATGLGSMN